MDSSVIINSLGVAGVIFIVLLMIWFATVYMKRRIGPDQLQAGPVSVQKVNWEEKRRQPRLAVSWKASIDTGQGPVKVQIKDVSQGGAFVVCKNPLPLKSKLKITLIPEDQGQLGLNAEVIWSNMNVPADKVVNRGMGIRFINNDETSRNRLNQIIVTCFEEDD